MNKKLKIFFFLLLIFSLIVNIVLIFMTSGAIHNGTYTSGEFLPLVKIIQGVSVDANSGENSSAILHYAGLNKTISQDILNYNATGNVGVYVEDTKTGAWFGINERTGFFPASLLKIPIMMAVLKKVQSNEINLNDNIELIPSDSSDVAKWGNLSGTSGVNMTVLELLRQMVAFSDNTAKEALKRQLTQTELDAVFVHVGITDPYISDDQTVSPRGYTRLFKALYYSTYLAPHYSELGLEIARDDKDHNLISQGVPTGVEVSHKFGAFEEWGVLHDCGIVYHPQNPYFICIMTKSLDTNLGGKLIPQISKDIYDYVDNESNN